MPEKETKNISPSKATAAKTIFEAFKILKSEGGELPGKEVIDRIRQNVQFTDWEKEVYEKTGYVRWEAILHFYTVDCAKAGYLRKSKGTWYLTPEGEQAMKLGPVEMPIPRFVAHETSSRNYITDGATIFNGKNAIQYPTIAESYSQIYQY